MGGRTAEGSGPHGGQTGRRGNELDGRGGSESAGRCVDMKFRKIQRGQFMKGLKGEKQNLEVDTDFNGEPVKLPKNCDIIYGTSSGNDTGNSVLDHLKFLKTLERKTKGESQ